MPGFDGVLVRLLALAVSVVSQGVTEKTELAYFSCSRDERL